MFSTKTCDFDQRPSTWHLRIPHQVSSRSFTYDSIIIHHFCFVFSSLDKAQKLVETENVEFFVLVQRMQEINRKLESDTQRLKENKIE